jgi:hypothetical protein
MSPRRVLGHLAIGLLLLSLCAAVPAIAASGGGASAAAAKKKCKKGHTRHGSKCVKVKKKAKAKVKPLKVPVSVDLLDGSRATLDVGDGAPRELPLTGTLKGFIAGKIDLTKDTTVTLTSGDIKPGVADVLFADCNGTRQATARVNPASLVSLDPAQKSTATLKTDGTVASYAYTVIRYVLDVAQGDCTQPLVPAGYSDLPAVFSLTGKLAPATGLSSLALDSQPVGYAVGLCLTPGDPAKPCAGAPVSTPVTITTHLIARVDLSP